MSAKFEFYEVVMVDSDRPNLKKVNGLTGAIMGRVEDDGKWGYSVHIFDDGESWHIMENELIATERFMKREDFYDGDSIKVIVDPETGEGRIKDE